MSVAGTTGLVDLVRGGWMAGKKIPAGESAAGQRVTNEVVQAVLSNYPEGQP